MNIFRGKKDSLRGLNEKWYDAFADQSRVLEVPYGPGYSVSVRVPKLEHLLAMKIGNSRAKDLMDNKNLTDLAKKNNQELNFAELDEILIDSPDNYSRFLSACYPQRIVPQGLFK